MCVCVCVRAVAGWGGPGQLSAGAEERRFSHCKPGEVSAGYIHSHVYTHDIVCIINPRAFMRSEGLL